MHKVSGIAHPVCLASFAGTPLAQLVGELPIMVELRSGRITRVISLFEFEHEVSGSRN